MAGAAIRVRADGIVVRVRLTPRGGRDALEGWEVRADGREHLKARVGAPPDKGKANAALCALLAARLHVAKSQVRIVSGDTGRIKSVEIMGPPDRLRASLEALGDVA